jgi:hypothetical protein
MRSRAAPYFAGLDVGGRTMKVGERRTADAALFAIITLPQ